MEKHAPAGKYRVIGYDTFDPCDWHEGDFGTKQEALDHANRKGGPMTLMYVFDDTGKQLARAGKF